MSTEENKALVRRWYEEVFNQGNLDVVDNYVADTIVDHSLPPGMPPGAASTRQLIAMYRNAFPDLQITVEDQISEGDQVVNRIQVVGTHQGEFMGIAPTGRQFTITGIDWLRIADGKFVEHWAQADMLGLLQQLGAIPAPGQ